MVLKLYCSSEKEACEVRDWLDEHTRNVCAITLRVSERQLSLEKGCEKLLAINSELRRFLEHIRDEIRGWSIEDRRDFLSQHRDGGERYDALEYLFTDIDDFFSTGTGQMTIAVRDGFESPYPLDRITALLIQLMVFICRRNGISPYPEKL